ncbi:MAG: YdgA family protein [Gammaproteobacteria bacterium]|nr:YdgA family protein [Gammaproteobacteria bacterium]MDH3432263.1 YdgA family protein [Gammaproteobacteria bacterium]
MKKGFVALLIVLAVVVLVSPGIVGRLAEKSMDENLDWAAAESQDVVVKSQGFDRGWFSSAGQHRVEVRNGDLRDLLLALADEGPGSDLPVLIIDTRLDHGLVPVTSMTRDEGSLMPGLGRAVSTLSLEFDNGERVDLPGTIYSEVSLTGELSSSYKLQAGSFSRAGSTVNWGDSDLLVTTNPSDSSVDFRGAFEELSVVTYDSDISLIALELEGSQKPTKFGFSVGDISMSIASITLPTAQGTETIGPILLDTAAEMHGDLVSGRTKMRLNNVPFGDLGPAGIFIDATIKDMDGAAIGNITRVLEQIDSYGSPDEAMFYLQDDLQRLLAKGFELQVEHLDIALPEGKLETRIDVSATGFDVDEFSWPAALLALDASFDLRVPAALMDIATAMDPQINGAVGMGFLRRNGDVYEMQAAFENGLLTVNGAPMPIPGFQ